MSLWLAPPQNLCERSMVLSLRFQTPRASQLSFCKACYQLSSVWSVLPHLFLRDTSVEKLPTSASLWPTFGPTFVFLNVIKQGFKQLLVYFALNTELLEDHNIIYVYLWLWTGKRTLLLGLEDFSPSSHTEVSASKILHYCVFFLL